MKIFQVRKIPLSVMIRILNILEGLLADKVQQQQPIDLQFHQSIGESSTSQLKSNKE